MAIGLHICSFCQRVLSVLHYLCCKCRIFFWFLFAFFPRPQKARGIYCHYFALPSKCWYSGLFIPLIYFCLPCSSAKKCRVCLCNPRFAMFLFIFCYSSLYLVTLCCSSGLISLAGSLKFRVALSYKDNRTSHTALDVPQYITPHACYGRCAAKQHDIGL